MRLLIIALMCAISTTAFAVSADVRSNCTDDYFRFCSHTSPGTPECKNCFRSVGKKLSSRCLAAIARSDEFGKEYNRRKERVKQKVRQRYRYYRN